MFRGISQKEKQPHRRHKKLFEEQEKLKKELADIETGEQKSKDEASRIEEEILKTAEEIESLGEKEKELIAALEKQKNLPADLVEMMSERLKISGKEEPDDLEEISEQVGGGEEEKGLTNEEIKEGIKILEKRNEERIDDLKKALRITDRLIVQLPMNHKKEFCSSRTFNEYEKLHKMVFDYHGTPIEKKYIRENTKWILREVDKLLGKLPEEEIDRFLASDDFEQYSRILEAYGIAAQ